MKERERTLTLRILSRLKTLEISTKNPETIEIPGFRILVVPRGVEPLWNPVISTGFRFSVAC